MAATAGCQYGATLVRGIGRGFKRFTDWPCPCDPKMIRLWKSMEIYSADLSFGFQRSVMKVRPPPGGPIADAMTLDSWKSTNAATQNSTQNSTLVKSKHIETCQIIEVHEVQWSSLKFMKCSFCKHIGIFYSRFFLHCACKLVHGKHVWLSACRDFDWLGLKFLGALPGLWCRTSWALSCPNISAKVAIFKSQDPEDPGKIGLLYQPPWSCHCRSLKRKRFLSNS